MSINWITPGVTGRRTGSTTKNLAFSVANHKAGKAVKAATQGVLCVFPLAMKALRWQAGDRVMLGLSDDKRDVYIKRVPSGGFTLSPRGGDKKGLKAGSPVACVVKTSQIHFAEPADIGPSDYIVMDDGTVMFSIKGGA